MIELRYPKIEEAEEYLRILKDGKYEFYYAVIPEDVEEEIKWIKKCSFLPGLVLILIGIWKI